MICLSWTGWSVSVVLCIWGGCWCVWSVHLYRVRSAWWGRYLTRVYLSGNLQDFCMICRIVNLDTSRLFTCCLSWMGSVWGRYFTRVYLSGNLICVICSSVWSAGSVWSTWVKYKLSIWYVHLDRDEVCTICMFCTRLSVGLHDPCLSVGLDDPCLSVGLHDLQDLYDLYDLQDLYYLAGVYLSGILVCVICSSSPGRICMIFMNCTCFVRRIK